MTLAEFIESTSRPEPPDLPPPLLALWHAGRRDWNTAHEIAQAIDTRDGAGVHAHLHRVEGDLGNARYWYRRAGLPEATDALDAEWQRMASALLGATGEAAARPGAVATPRHPRV